MATRPTTSAAIVHDTPVRSRESADFWGSDAVAAMLRELGIRYIALNPGASYRGLHDSIVNYLGNRDAADGAVPARRDRGRRSRTATGRRRTK